MAGLADAFPESLPAFQRMFPDDAACAQYLKAIRWRDGFECPRCKSTVVHTAQYRHPPDVMAVFKKAIPCLLDWSDEPALWSQIGPIEGGILRTVNGVPDNVIWPCPDGPRAE
jgi:hypothetical protein